MRLPAPALPAIVLVVVAACGGEAPASRPGAVTPATTATAHVAVSATAATASPTPTPRPAEPATGDLAEATPMVIAAFPSLSAFERPIAMVELPGERRFLLALQDGRVLSFPTGEDARATVVVLDLVPRVSRDGNEEGLLSIGLDPDYTTNHYVYLYYSAKPGERRTVLSRFSTSGTGEALRLDPASELVLLTVPPPFANHNGGTVLFGPEGMLYLGLGDGGSAGDPQGNGQDISRNLLGSIIRVDVRGATAAQPYRIPASNPFADGRGGARPETWAYGFRNPWRMSFDRQTGLLWVGDVGQNAREEVDMVRRGENYGWNVMEGFDCFRAQQCDRTGLSLPVYDYGRENGACSITGGYVYRGAAVPALRGWYVFADFCSGSVRAIRASVESSPGTRPEAITILGRGPSIASFAEDIAGELYLLSFDGRIYRFAAR